MTRVPGIEEKIGAESDYTLLDQIKLYLLGLPNDIGPLGFVALHSVLEVRFRVEDLGVDLNPKIIEILPESDPNLILT